MVSEKIITILLVIAIVLSVVSIAITLISLSINKTPEINIIQREKGEDQAGKISLIIEPSQTQELINA